MTDTPALSPDPQAAQLQGVWVDCFRSVLGQVAGFPVTVEPAGEQESAAAQEVLQKPPVWSVIAAGKSLRGEMAILATQAEAALLAQLLVTEPPDPNAAFDNNIHRDAYEELLRQVMGQVATGLKSVVGGEVELKEAGSDAPSWPRANRVGIRIAGEKFQPIHLLLVVTPELSQSMRSALEKAQPEKAAATPVSPPEPSGDKPSNLELLLDVKLDATIRFGQKQILLRDILALRPGSAVSLDRHVDEPVELLVGGRVVAWGEVVVVDRNYGLRITEILTPQQRIEELRS